MFAGGVEKAVNRLDRVTETGQQHAVRENTGNALAAAQLLAEMLRSASTIAISASCSGGPAAMLSNPGQWFLVRRGIVRLICRLATA